MLRIVPAMISPDVTGATLPGVEKRDGN